MRNCKREPFFIEQQEASKLSSLTYENLEASSGRLSSLLSTGSGEDTGTTGTNEYYEEVDFRNGVASKAASATKRENSSEITVEYDDDDDKVHSISRVLLCSDMKIVISDH